MQIKQDNLRGKEIIQLLQEHLDNMIAITPPGSVHALDLDKLRLPEITFWTLWDEKNNLMGCGALKDLGDGTGEIKSMRTKEDHRGKGVASSMLEHIISEAQERSYTHLYLETGAFPAFKPARTLYEKYEFNYSEPFAGYKENSNSVFMKKEL